MPAVPPAAAAGQVVLHFEVRVKPEKTAEFPGHVAAMTASAPTEPGCLFYRYHTVGEDPAHYILWEVWASRADLERHLGHLTTLFGRPPKGAALPLPTTLSDCFADLRVLELTPVPGT